MEEPRVGSKAEVDRPRAAEPNPWDTTLRSFVPVTGDWFLYNVVYDAGETRLFLSRIIAWALAGGVHYIDHVVGIDESGTPHSHDSDPFCVCGTDLSPNGQTWNQAFLADMPAYAMRREITGKFPLN